MILVRTFQLRLFYDSVNVNLLLCTHPRQTLGCCWAGSLSPSVWIEVACLAWPTYLYIPHGFSGNFQEGLLYVYTTKAKGIYST